MSFTNYAVTLSIALLGLTALSGQALAGDKIKVKGCTVAPEGTPWEQQMKETLKTPQVRRGT